MRMAVPVIKFRGRPSWSVLDILDFVGGPGGEEVKE
jgi:hypothetical protein